MPNCLNACLCSYIALHLFILSYLSGISLLIPVSYQVFEVAQSKLGIPALLDAKDMVSTEVPDRLSIITYLSHYYHCFNKKSHASLKTPCVAECSSHSKKQPDSLGGLQPAKSRAEERFNRGRPCSICASCTKHVHLVQRHLTEGKLYHRSCFR
uniref:LIM zinc-binding domain-containing protein n=1 Tax=Hucho hucho TaxID=62062 RepID=A0A4W5JRS0_9TELE